MVHIWHGSRAEFLADNIAGTVKRVSVAEGEHTLHYRRVDTAPVAVTSAGGGLWVPDGIGTPQHFGALDTALDWYNAGGDLHIPTGDYDAAFSKTLTRTNGHISGDGPWRSVLNGLTLDYSTEHNFTLRDVNISGGRLSVGLTAGTKDYAARYEIERVFVQDGLGFRFGKSVHGKVTDCISIRNSGIGLDFSHGYATQYDVVGSQAMECGGDGWRIKNIAYSVFKNVSADRNGGYGYHLENLNGVTLEGGAELNGKSAVRFHHDAATTDLVKRHEATTVRMFDFRNDQSGTSGATMAHFTASELTTPAGQVILDGLSDFVSPSGYSIRIASGAYTIHRGANGAKWKTAGGAYSAVVDPGATAGLSFRNITKGVPIGVARLTNRMANDIASYGGQITVTATSTHANSTSRNATYVLQIHRGVGDGAATIQVLKAMGNLAGRTPDSASFNWSLNTATKPNLLVARPKDRTAGPFRFTFACLGDIHAEPL